MTDNHRQIERDAALWLARRDAGGWADRQQTALDAWLGENAAHRVAFLRLEAVWQESARLKTFAAGDMGGYISARGEWARSPYFAPLDTHSNARRGRRATLRKQRRWPIFAGIAASLLVAAAIAGGFIWHGYTRVDSAAWKTAMGARKIVHLPDGSTATLGSETDLHMAFSRRERDLELTRGEAFFDVAHDAARPFVVHANGYRVIAVGTRFDVRHDAGRLRVVVTRGLVRLQSASDPAKPPAMLPAGSIATVADGGDVAISQVTADEASEALSWRSGFVVFHRTPLAEAVREFNRYNTRQIVIADSSLDALRVGGNFKLDNRDAFVRLMQAVFPVEAQQRGRDIVLTRKSQAHTAH